jgi:DnaJ family protein C protein 11
LPGFYDPCAGEAKVLLIQYAFRGQPHSVVVEDDQPIYLPKASHQTI